MSVMSRCCSASTCAATSACAGVMVRSLGDDPWQRAAVQQIADWLEKLGMSEYAQDFVDNDNSGGADAPMIFLESLRACPRFR